MTQNIGTADRAVRIVIGIVMLLAAALLEHQARWFGLIGFVPLLTGIFGHCPMYSLFGINTCSLPRMKV